MEEIRCPMCGKPNPDHLEICQHCQARLKPLVLSADESSSGEANDADTGLPDWQPSDQQDEPTSEDETALEADSEGDDWLTRLREEGDSEPIGLTPPDEPPETEEPAEEDWLLRIREMRDADAAPPAEDDSSSISDEVLPSWMTAQEDESGEQETSESDLSTPDPPSTGEERAEQLDAPASSAEDSELPEWLTTSEEGAPPTPLQASEAEVPDWLSAPEEDGEEDTPEAEQPSAEPPTPATEPGAELPDWLTAIGEEPPDPELSGESEAEIPEWLSTAEEIEPDDFPKESQPVDDGIPDWMSGVDDPDAEPDLSTIPAEPDPETPDWLSGLEVEGLGWPTDPSEADSPGEDLEPDWLEEIGEGAAPGQVPEEASPSPFLPEDDLDESVFEIDELTDLLSGADEDLEIPATADDADGLPPAELPRWLEAMRPVDSPPEGTGDIDQGQVEQTGPLAGLSGVLMAEPEIARLKQAPKLSSKLQITPAQQDHVRVFRELLATEGQAQHVPQPIVVSSQGLLRWLSAFFLILVIALVVINEVQWAPRPPLASVPAEVLNVSELINTLSPQDPVLVSFDYEPGTSGEMEAAAAAVVDHLMLRGAYLTLVSTSPTGPALAEHFITTVQEEHHYVSGNQFVNLGYIPGGASGLLGFVQMPQRIRPLSFDGMNAWTTQPLRGVYALSDFKLVVVITDNPDTARTWIEQVQPKIEETPLVTVVSAQAEPIIHPYVGGENAQVRGMVGGVIGGASYEQVTGKPNLAQVYWDALNFGLLTAIAVILIGGVANVFLNLFRNKPQGEAS